jgi:hypothetical protein
LPAAPLPDYLHPARREIRCFQGSVGSGRDATRLLIPRAPFLRLLREMLANV